jgi:lipopolysaccharide export LptBFGC system permease protein LptF
MMVIDKKQLKTNLIIALCAIVICFISVRLALGSAGIGGVLIGLFFIFVCANFILYMMAEGNEKYSDAYSLSLIGTVAIPSIVVIAYLIVTNIK